MDRLDELSVFVAILDSGSLAGAGRLLHRSPPAITRCLVALEDRLGTRLVERTTRRLLPTEAGRRLLGQARRLLADYGETVRSVAADEPLRGQIRITAPVVFGRRHVMPIISDFLRRYPHIGVEAQFSDSNLDLFEAEIDVAIRIGPLADPALKARRVGEVRRMLVAHPDYVQAWGTPVCVADLARHQVIFTAARPMAAEWRLMENGRERVVRLAPRIIVNQVEAALSAARDGLGIAQALSYQVVDDLAAGHLIRLLPHAEPAALPVHLVVSGARQSPARTRIFLDHAAGALRAVGVIRPLPQP